MNKDKVKLLHERFGTNTKFEMGDLDELLDLKTYREPSLSTFSSINKVFWMKDYFIDREIEKAKQFLFVIGIISNMTINKRITIRNGIDRWKTNTYMRLGPTIEILSMLLSDNTSLLSEFKSWQFDDIDPDPQYGNSPTLGLPVVIQALLKGDKEYAKKHVKKYRAHFQGADDDKYFGRDADLMEAMIKGDEKEVSDFVMHICKPETHKNRIEFHTFEKKFLSLDGTAILKTMWILGHEIEVDHPLIPMELMPIRPLDKYEVPYFFLEGFEGELPENYKEWLRKQNKKKEDKKEEVVSEVKTWNKEKYSNRAEQVTIENALEQGMIVKGNKDDGWEIFKE